MKRKAIFGAAVLVIALGAGSAFASGPRQPSTTIGADPIMTSRAASAELVAHRKGFTSITVVEGVGVRLVQADPIWDHAIVSVAKNGKGRPLFSSDVLRAGEAGWIEGVERLEPGTYAFRDQVYSWWQGTITVVAADAEMP